MELAIIVQARMGSTRLPGKVLLEASGRPLLVHMLERLRTISAAGAVVVATTTSPADDPLAALAESQGALVVRGPEEDVLTRYVMAARRVDARHIMRATADCPLIDPHVCERVFALHLERHADYSATSPEFAEGLDCEIVTRQALEVSDEQAVLASEREHVTLHIRNHPERFRLRHLPNDRDDSRYRITVDEPADFKVVESVLAHLAQTPHAGYGFDQVRRYLDAHPEVVELNTHIIRNEGLLKSLTLESEQGEAP